VYLLICFRSLLFGHEFLKYVLANLCFSTDVTDFLKLLSTVYGFQTKSLEASCLWHRRNLRSTRKKRFLEWSWLFGIGASVEFVAIRKQRRKAIKVFERSKLSRLDGLRSA